MPEAKYKSKANLHTNDANAPSVAEKKYEELLKHIPIRINECLDEADRLLTLPYETFRHDNSEINRNSKLVDIIRGNLKAQAVSIFLVSEKSKRLEFSDGVGYKEEYRGKSYDLGEEALTSYVYRTKEPLNLSRDEINLQTQIPFTGSCDYYLQSGELRNIIAVPILFQKACLGVLKLENGLINKDDNSPIGKEKGFGVEEFVLAQLLAQIIGVAFQERIYTDLWRTSEELLKNKKNLESYIAETAALLAVKLQAECAGFFRYLNGCLNYAGGVGFKEEAVREIRNAEKVKPLGDMLVRETLSMSRADIMSRNRTVDIRILGPYLEKGDVRNIQTHHLELKDEKGIIQGTWIILIANKLPLTAEAFGANDARMFHRVAEEHIMMALQKLKESVQPIGFELLVKEFRPREEKVRGKELERLLKDIWEFKKQNKTVTADDCAAYLKVTKQHLYRLLDLKRAKNNEEVVKD